MTAIHVVPLGDLVDHDSSGEEDCICGPDAELLPDGTWLISHHSLDGRELDEEPEDDGQPWSWRSGPGS